jgi:hypothetical protein
MTLPFLCAERSLSADEKKLFSQMAEVYLDNTFSSSHATAYRATPWSLATSAGSC